MTKPIINQEVLKSGDRAAIVWQGYTDGVAEPALAVRTYGNTDDSLPLIEIQQGDHCILINGETVADLFKMLREWIKPTDS